jgi:hypothetical protein
MAAKEGMVMASKGGTSHDAQQAITDCRYHSGLILKSNEGQIN